MEGGREGGREFGCKKQKTLYCNSITSYRSCCTGEFLSCSFNMVGWVLFVRIASVHAVIAGNGQEKKTQLKAHRLYYHLPC